MEVIGMNVDLKLLMILDEVYKTGSVSRAAANIGMTQPSISITLAKPLGEAGVKRADERDVEPVEPDDRLVARLGLAQTRVPHLVNI
jgi:DNA-binding transcriptional ArsR family regulator